MKEVSQSVHSKVKTDMTAHIRGSIEIARCCDFLFGFSKLVTEGTPRIKQKNTDRYSIEVKVRDCKLKYYLIILNTLSSTTWKCKGCIGLEQAEPRNCSRI